MFWKGFGIFLLYIPVYFLSLPVYDTYYSVKTLKFSSRYFTSVLGISGAFKKTVLSILGYKKQVFNLPASDRVGTLVFKNLFMEK